MPRAWSARLSGLLCITVLAAGCTSTRPARGPLQIVASFYPLYEFARRIGGARVTVANLVPAGAGSHDYEPTAQDLITLKRARLFVYNGAGLEPWVDRLLPEVSATALVVRTTDGLPLAPGPVSSEPDPHVWLDPVLAQRQARAILAGLVQVDPEGKAEYEANAAGLDADLASLHERFAVELRACRRREFITSHAAFGYLGRRYSLVQIAISGATPEADVSPARLAYVVALARRLRVPVVFYEPAEGAQLAQTVAREIGARVDMLHPLEGLTLQELREGKTYVTVMDANRERLAQALDCPR